MLLGVSILILMEILMKKIVFLVAVFGVFFASCGKSKEDVPDLFSKWKTEDGGFLDFTGAAFNTPFLMRVIIDHGSCYATFTFIGDQNSGGYAIEDQTCSLGNDSGRYTKNKTTLTLCSSDQSCLTLHK